MHPTPGHLPMRASRPPGPDYDLKSEGKGGKHPKKQATHTKDIGGGRDKEAEVQAQDLPTRSNATFLGCVEVPLRNTLALAGRTRALTLADTVWLPLTRRQGAQVGVTTCTLSSR
jgi:hypothetical protein